MKKLVIFSFLILFLIILISLVIAEDSASNESSSGQKVTVNPGMTPDNALYFFKDIYERFTVGNNPEKALAYKEEKIAEAQAMVDKGNPDAAKKVLDRAMQYSDIVAKETSPDMTDQVQESSDAVQNTVTDLKEKTSDAQLKEKIDETIAKEKQTSTAAELASKIAELCDTLAKLDPLQYADSCKPKTNSPGWMKEQDQQLTKEQEQQAQIFFDKLSACFENPKNCDCKGMGVQSFEDFCMEQNALAIKCMDGDKASCDSVNKGAPEDLLPSYLVSVMKQVESKYSKAQFDNFAPQECVNAHAKTPQECNKIMFKLTASQECLDAGLTGASREDDVKCRTIMFEKNTPKECLDAGITASDKDGARKCSKLMFQSRAPQACLDAGLTGESRDDEIKCKQLTGQGNSGNQTEYKQAFSKNCNSISDVNEKMTCYQEFYNNAQANVKDDFRQREMTDTMTGEVITSEEQTQRDLCAAKGMGTILEHENGRRVVICVDKNQAQPQGQGGLICQSQQETESMRQNCKNSGQDSRVEMKGGCPWVICISGNNQQQQNQANYQQVGNYIASPNTGIKCPDGICDDYEKMNPYACPEDCGGTRQPGNYPQQQPGNYQQPQQNQQPGNYQQQPGNYQQPQQNMGCSETHPYCDVAPYCQNGNWVCPASQQQQQPMQPQQPQQQQNVVNQPQQNQQPGNYIQQPQQQQNVVTIPTQDQNQQQQPLQEQQPQTQEPSSESGGTTAPVTGGAITGRVIVSEYGDANSRSGDRFLDYWFQRGL